MLLEIFPAGELITKLVTSAILTSVYYTSGQAAPFHELFYVFGRGYAVFWSERLACAVTELSVHY